LKNDKASGDDFIVNEYIKSSIDIILPVYIKMFNCIFSSGIDLFRCKTFAKTTQNGNRAKVFWIQRIAFVFIKRFNVS
jgi:hypothetical protein